jgi:AcrR family transcriptional regulator
MPEDIPPTRRERQIAARQEQILSAAARLFAEKGFYRATTKEIAEAAEVSEGTLYNYFANKEALLTGILEQLVESQKFEENLDETLPGDGRDFLHATLQNHNFVLRENKTLLLAALTEILADQELRQKYYTEFVQPDIHLLEQHLQENVHLGHLRPMNIPRAARTLLGATLGLFLLNILGDPLVRTEWDELSGSMTAMLYEGVKPDIE